MLVRLTILFCLLFVPCLAQPRETVLITCATGELGAATARLLASDYNLLLTGRNQEKLECLQRELQTNHEGQYEIFSLDYSDKESIDKLVKQLAPLNGFVLITPRPQFYGKELLQEERVWLEVIQNTFTRPLELLKGVLQHLVDKSKIVVIAGTSSVQFLPDGGPNCVLRRMWTSYVKALSHELGPRGIRINSVSPGVILTPFHQARIQKKAEENGESYAAQLARDVANIPLKRHGKPDEVAKATRFLLSDSADFITGTNMVLDGGITVSY